MNPLIMLTIQKAEYVFKLLGKITEEYRHQIFCSYNSPHKAFPSQRCYIYLDPSSPIYTQLLLLQTEKY